MDKIEDSEAEVLNKLLAEFFYGAGNVFYHSSVYTSPRFTPPKSIHVFVRLFHHNKIK